MESSDRRRCVEYEKIFNEIFRKCRKTASIATSVVLDFEKQVLHMKKMEEPSPITIGNSTKEDGGLNVCLICDYKVVQGYRMMDHVEIYHMCFGDDSLHKIHQLYLTNWIWKDDVNEEVQLISVQLTSLKDVKLAASKFWTCNKIASGKIKDGKDLTGCSCRSLIAKGLIIKPEAAIPLNIFSLDLESAHTLKYFLRHILRAKAHQKPKSSKVRCDNVKSHIFDLINPILSKLPAKNISHFQNKWLNTTLTPPPSPGDIESPTTTTQQTDLTFETTPSTSTKRKSPFKPRVVKKLSFSSPAPQHKEELDSKQGSDNDLDESGQETPIFKSKKYTQNDMNQAIKAVRNGGSVAGSALKFGVPYCTLDVRIKELGIVLTYSQKLKRKKQYTPKDMDQALEAVRNGLLSYGKAAAKFGVPKGTLVSKMKKFNLAKTDWSTDED